MTAVTSEAIREIDYDVTTSTLLVRFSDGDWYRYFNVPRAIHDAFLRADSHGRFFHTQVRDRFAFRQGR